MTINKFITKGGFLLLGCLAAGSVAYSQSTTSPYSMFGIGEVDMGNYGENSGMAGLGIGYRQVNTLNSTNPASLTTLAQKTFVLDGSVFGKYVDSRARGKTSSTLTGNLQRLSFGFTPGKNWGTSFGILPYSSVGYSIATVRDVEGNPGETFTTRFEGSGGLTKIYIANAVRLFNRLSLGVNTSYIFGTINHNEVTDVFAINRQLRTGKVYFDFGAQFTGDLNENWMYSLGAVYGYKQQLKMETKVMAFTSNGSQVQDDTKPSKIFHLPEYYGGGLQLTRQNKLSLGVDYSLHKWSSMGAQDGVHYVDMHTGRFGVSYVPNVYNPRKYAEIIKYQFGVTVGNSYLKIKDKNPINYSVSAGTTLPLKNNADINVSLEYGQFGDNYSNNKSIRENFVKLTLGVSFREIWFMRFLFQ